MENTKMEEKYLKKMKFKETVIDNMIQNVNKGVSGFSYSKGPSCLNYEIIKSPTRKIEDYPYICPWNKLVLYGSRGISIQKGCPRTIYGITRKKQKKAEQQTAANEDAIPALFCGIKIAELLTKEERLAVLNRFRKNLRNGVYKNERNIPPLLNKKEISLLQERSNLQTEEGRAKGISNLVKKYPEWEEDLKECYGTNIAWSGTGVHFAPESKCNVVGADELSYNEYIEAQMLSIDEHRHDLAMCEHYNNYGIFRGRVSKVNDDYICFEKLYVQTGDEKDDFFGEEDHIWVNRKQFNGCKLKEGNCLQFEGLVQRYVKRSKGYPQIDYGIETVKAFKRI